MSPPGGLGPEQQARQQIDAALEQAGWKVQDFGQMNLGAALGVAVREFPMKAGHGFADYLLFVEFEPVGVLEAKKVGHTLSGVASQTEKYSEGLPDNLDPPVRPLPFLYASTGVVTRFKNLLDPKPRSRRIFTFHRPQTLKEWLEADTLDKWIKGLSGAGGSRYTAADDSQPSSFRGRLKTSPPVDRSFLYPNQVRAITGLEQSLKEDRPRALIQMATGSGKTIAAVTSVYRQIKFAGARRVLFLVDRSNLGEQAEKEFEGFRAPDDNRKFTELYNVQRLTSNTIGASSKVVITTIQRFYSMLKGEPEFNPEDEEGSQFETTGAGMKEPLPVVYNSAYPPEYFDVIYIDECHRSIYSLWRQVLEYFDAFLVGLTATPAKHTYGFFNKNLVMEYDHAEAVADGVNVDFEIYSIRTAITEGGSTIDAGPATLVKYRHRETRDERWERADEDIVYGAKELDRRVVAIDQIRLIVQTFKAKVRTEIFPGRTNVPKTLIFAKDDSHAEDIVGIIREEFGEGDRICEKITYKVTGKKPADLIQDFRNSFYPRIAVTVDMVATGTDIKPVEIVMFMRSVKSSLLFDQMKGRGVRIIDPTALKAVTPDAHAKTHFVIVDCVGVTESDLHETRPLERKRFISFKALLEHVAMGGTDPDMLSSLASRLARLDKQCGPAEIQQIVEASGGPDLKAMSHAIVEALDADKQIGLAQSVAGLGPEDAPTEKQLKSAAKTLAREAARPLATAPELRRILLDIKRQLEQIIDEVSIDALTYAGASPEAKKKAKSLVHDFEAFLETHKGELDALQFFYSVPHRERLRYKDLKALAAAIQAPPRSWTPERLWRAYETLEAGRVKEASGKRLLTDIVSLVRFALHEEDELVPYAERVHERFQAWMAQQANKGRTFTPDQVTWLGMIRDHVAQSMELDMDDFDLAPFVENGGLGKAYQVFGKDLGGIVKELNEVLAA